MSPIISFLLLMATIGPLSAFANDIEITPPQVVIANGTNLSVESTVLHCKSSEQHQYCEWTSPDSLKCAPKNCPLEGVTVASDYQTCSVTINHDIHSDYGNHAGDWSCDLFFIRSKTPERNASTHLYIVDLSEMPIIRQSSTSLATMDFFESGDTKEVAFQCSATTKAPLKTYQWYFNGTALASKESSDKITLKLTRQNFNATLKCLVELDINKDQHIGSISTTEKLIFQMNPVILDILKIKEDNYQIETESWPMPSFVRISIVEGCNNDCVIYKLVNGKYEIDTSPYMKDQSSFVKDVVIQGQVYGAKSRINIHFNQKKLKDIKEIFIAIGNDLNVANAKIDLKAAPHEYRSSSLEKVKLNDMTPLIVGLSVGLIVLIILIILIVAFRSRISQAFQCGSYFIPPTSEDAAAANDEDIEHNKLVTDEQKIPLDQNGTKIPPETEF